MNLQILDFNNFFIKFINSLNIIKTSNIDIKLDCLKSKNKLKQINLFSKNSII